jgi:hypothetical protein
VCKRQDYVTRSLRDIVRKGCCTACKPSQIVDLRWKSGESYQLIVTESKKFLHLSRLLDCSGREV